MKINWTANKYCCSMYMDPFLKQKLNKTRIYPLSCRYKWFWCKDAMVQISTRRITDRSLQYPEAGYITPCQVQYILRRIAIFGHDYPQIWWIHYWNLSPGIPGKEVTANQGHTWRCRLVFNYVKMTFLCLFLLDSRIFKMRTKWQR